MLVAVKHECFEAVRYLFIRGADFKVQDENGELMTQSQMTGCPGGALASLLLSCCYCSHPAPGLPARLSCICDVLASRSTRMRWCADSRDCFILAGPAARHFVTSDT